jgi:hypothetical protein
MKNPLTRSCLVLLCFSSAAAIGGGLYESVVMNPQWSASPPASFAIIQPDTGVPFQRFWMPVHGAITLLSLAALVLTWRDRTARRWMMTGVASYWAMRTWSFLFFIPEMLAFQQISVDSAPTPELLERVASWTRWTLLREPLDVITFVSFLMALSRLARSPSGQSVPAGQRTRSSSGSSVRPACPSTSSSFATRTAWTRCGTSGCCGSSR